MGGASLERRWEAIVRGVYQQRINDAALPSWWLLFLKSSSRPYTMFRSARKVDLPETLLGEPIIFSVLRSLATRSVTSGRTHWEFHTPSWRVSVPGFADVQHRQGLFARCSGFAAAGQLRLGNILHGPYSVPPKRERRIPYYEYQLFRPDKAEG